LIWDALSPLSRLRGRKKVYGGGRGEKGKKKGGELSFLVSGPFGGGRGGGGIQRGGKKEGEEGKAESRDFGASPESP